MIELSDEFLQRLAGTAMFEQALALQRSDAVGELQQVDQRITARIADGDAHYLAQIRHTQSQLDTQCECDTSAGFDVCPHSIALALAWRDQLDARQQAARGSDSERLALYVRNLSNEQQIRSLLELIERDESLTHQWLLAADRSLGTLTSTQLRKRINQLLPMQNRSAGALIDAVQDCDTMLQQCKTDLHPAQLCELCAYTLQRLASHEQAAVIAQHCTDSIEHLQQGLLTGLAHSEWSSSVVIAFVLEMMLSEHADFLPLLPDAALAPLGDAQQQALFDAIEQAWHHAAADASSTEPCAVLLDALQRNASSSQDLKKLATLLAQTADAVDDYLQLCDLHLQLGDNPAAADWLQRARNASRDSGDRAKITRASVALSLAQGDRDAAFDAQWALFRNTLRAADLLPALTLCELDRDALFRRGAEEIHRQIDNATKQRGQAILFERLAGFLLDIGDSEAAAHIAGSHAMNSELLQRLLIDLDDVALEIPLAFRLAQQWVETSSNPHYRKAVDLLAALAGRIDDRKLQQQFDESLRHLRQRMASKRNFLVWLNEALPVHGLPRP